MRKTITWLIAVSFIAAMVASPVTARPARGLLSGIENQENPQEVSTPPAGRERPEGKQTPQTPKLTRKEALKIWWEMTKFKFRWHLNQGPSSLFKMFFSPGKSMLEEYKVIREQYKKLHEAYRESLKPPLPPPDQVVKDPKPDKKSEKKPKEDPDRKAIAELYRKHLGRDPDPGGLDHYYKLMKENGWDAGRIEKDIKNSQEYAEKHPEEKTPTTPPQKTGTVNAAVGLNMRTGPGVGNSRITTLPHGAKLTILAEQNGWYKVSSQGREGWVSGRYVNLGGFEPPAPKPEKKEGYITANGLNVRTGPGVGNSKIGLLPRGAAVTILGEQNGWYKIQFQGREAWVSGDYVAMGKSPDAHITDVKVSVDVPQRTQLDPANGQYQNYWCGPTSLGMVYEYYGRNETTRDVANRIYDFKGNTGTYAGSIVSDAKKNGFPNTEMKTGLDFGNLEGYLKEGKPVIVNVEVSYKYGHYMVLTGLSDDKVIINDPYYPGVRREMSRSAFLTDWNGRWRRAIVLQK
ncbi:MAG: SH3 domain-containing protein [bacterium]|nr:SH3 domain-containing protein [bacterium]